MSEHIKNVSVYIINWRSPYDTIKCVDSIYNKNYSIKHIYIIDNFSEDNSFFILKKYFSTYCNVHVFETDKNIGFGGGCNYGVNKTKNDQSEYIIFINNDAVAIEGAIDKMLNISINTYPSIVGAVVKDYATNKIQLVGGGLLIKNLVKTYHIKNIAVNNFDYICGVCMMIPKNKFIELNGFNEEKYFMYWEDTDLSLRAKKLGMNLNVSKDAIVWHKESSSLGKKSYRLDYYFNYSALSFADSNLKYKYIRFMFMFFDRIFLRIIKGEFYRIKAIINAYKDYFTIEI